MNPRHIHIDNKNALLCLRQGERVKSTHQVTLGQRHLLRLLEFHTSRGDELKGLPAVHQRFPNKAKEHRQSIPRIKGALNHTHKSLPLPPSLDSPRWEEILDRRSDLAAGFRQVVGSLAGCSCIFSSPSAPLSPAWPWCAALRSSRLDQTFERNHTKVTECPSFDVTVTQRHRQWAACSKPIGRDKCRGIYTSGPDPSWQNRSWTKPQELASILCRNSHQSGKRKSSVSCHNILAQEGTTRSSGLYDHLNLNPWKNQHRPRQHKSQLSQGNLSAWLEEACLSFIYFIAYLLPFLSPPKKLYHTFPLIKFWWVLQT